MMRDSPLDNVQLDVPLTTILRRERKSKRPRAPTEVKSVAFNEDKNATCFFDTKTSAEAISKRRKIVFSPADAVGKGELSIAYSPINVDKDEEEQQHNRPYPGC